MILNYTPEFKVIFILYQPGWENWAWDKNFHIKMLCSQNWTDTYSFYDWLSCYWFDFQPLGAKRNWRKKLSKQKQWNPSNVVPSIPCLNSWVNGTEADICSSVLYRRWNFQVCSSLNHLDWMQKTLGQNMVLKQGMTDSEVALGIADTMNRHTHTSSSQSSLRSHCGCHMPVIVDNKLNGNKKK